MTRALGNLIAGAVLLLACQSQAVSATAVYAVTYGGALYRSTDGASTWRQVPIPQVPAGTFTTWLGIDPVGNINLTLDVGGPKIKGPLVHALFRSVDGGQTWSQTNLPADVSMLLAVDPTAPNIIYGISRSGFVRSTDSGATFGDTGNVGILEIGADPQQPGVLYAPNPPRKSTDYGSTWTLLGSPAGTSVRSVAGNVTVDPHNSNVLYLPASGVCAPGVTNCGLFHSADGGTTWDTVNIPGSFYNVAFDSKSGAIYAGGVNKTGQVVKSADGGKTWTTFTTGLPGYAVKVYLDPNVSSTLYAAPATAGSHPGGVLVSTNSGAAWKLSPVAPAPDDVVPSMGVASGTPPPAPAVPALSIVSAASLRAGTLAPASLATALGSGLANATATPDADPPTTLGGTTVSIVDSAGTSWQAPLIYVSPTKINCEIPDGVALGAAAVTITPSSGPPQSAQTQIASVAPGVFTLNDAGLVAATVLRVSGDQQTYEDVFQTDDSGAIVARPIDMGPDTDQLSLIVSGTGFRAAGAGQTSVSINGLDAPVSSAGAQGTPVGVDQATVMLPRSLAGAGSVDLVLTAAGQTANTVNISFQ
ncbi:MAG TPA: hypothetical protein VFE56_07115 [Candidatus Binataceae bacterium]|nr:hypothetical protein [Candidatus Binataceae bacterium]